MKKLIFTILIYPLFLSTPASGQSKVITGQKVFSKEKTNLDFEAVDISGQRREPVGSLIRQKAADIEHDFVRLRMRWHPEMIQSAKSLEYAPRGQ